jgi:hypothetical protein
MSYAYPNGTTRHDFETAPDFLAYKPEGLCPWCGTKLLQSSETEWTGLPYCPRMSCTEYDSIFTEAENRERYANDAEDDAKTGERIGREMARREH